LHRAWLATEFLPGAVDLAQRRRVGPVPSRRELAAAMHVVRKMHDAGVEHRDLNLGNLLVRAGGEMEPEAFVVDLDAARLHDRPLDFGLRLRALRRLERSHVKLSLRAGTPRDDATRELYADLYAAGDARLAERLRRARPRTRLLIRLHTLGWARAHDD
jgi:aminoglycoside phosphotransferase (APT) family kinase protein